MTTIRDLADEFGAQPHEVAAFAALGHMPQDAPVSEDYVRIIREQWHSAPEGPVDTVTENRNADAVLFELAEVVDGADYDD